MRRRYPFRQDTWPGAWFTCDRCGTRFRRSEMHVEWDNLRVDIRCLDPRPPLMQPPNVYPEGLPFRDARPPQDRPDRLEDDTALQSVTGGIAIQNGALYPNGQQQEPGSLSPQAVYETTGDVDSYNWLATESGLDLVTESGQRLEISIIGVPFGPNVLADDITFVTGPVFFDAATNPPTWPNAPGPGGQGGWPSP